MTLMEGEAIRARRLSHGDVIPGRRLRSGGGVPVVRPPPRPRPGGLHRGLEYPRFARFRFRDRPVRGGARCLELQAHRAARVALVRVGVPVRPCDPPGHGDGLPFRDRLRRGVDGDACRPLDLQREVLVVSVVGVAGEKDPSSSFPGACCLRSRSHSSAGRCTATPRSRRFPSPCPRPRSRW